ncbi:MAG: hypothetical protein CVT77_00830 [Alphaproteobacteria bacterium HGW-Alphaproteobacteria-16]|nr:MAG: hypothetical protein CVT77_00830 [Alphaproteobacteria bacterium HGW-Alphaproteobacteria-16]
MSRDLAKTISYLAIHLTIGFSVAYLFTGSLAIAGGIALIEPLANAVAYFFHERAWNKGGQPAAPSCCAGAAIAT